ncbi:MAG: DUF2281 domain-containing protein [Acidobacteriota bacterium]|nr:DUF2281 domain-containing protein [Acidobacteriota bacterium]
MTVEETLLEKIKTLPMNRKQEVLDFAEFLEEKEAKPQPRRSLYGALADLDIKITEEDIAEARKEMWGNFPREHFFDGEAE